MLSELRRSADVWLGRLLDGDLLDGAGLFDLLDLREMDGQHAVLDFGFDLFGIYVVREQEHLLELLVGEFAAQVATAVLFFLVVGFLFHLYAEIVLFVDMDAEIVLGVARGCDFNLVGFVVFDYVDGRSGVGRSFHPAVVEEIIENLRQPGVGGSSDR